MQDATVVKLCGHVIIASEVLPSVFMNPIFYHIVVIIFHTLLPGNTISMLKRLQPSKITRILLVAIQARICRRLDIAISL